MTRPASFPFIRALAHRNRVRHSTVRAVFDSIADEVRAAVLERGERVVVPGLGVFYPKTQKAKRVLFPRRVRALDNSPSRRGGVSRLVVLQDCRHMRRAARTDANQTAIVKALRSVGASVQVLSAVGEGVPDLLAGRRGVNYLLEVKDGAKPLSAQKLTEAQEAWHQGWAGEVRTVRSVAEALRAVGVEASTA